MLTASDVAFVETVATWRSFYSLLGSAAATLTGLIFVALTFGATVLKDAKLEAPLAPRTVRAVLDPMLANFMEVLVISSLLLMPSLSARTVGVILAAMGAARLAMFIHAYTRHDVVKVDASGLAQQISAVFLPFATHVGLVAIGVAFALGRVELTALGAFVIADLLLGVHRAWEIAMWIAMARSDGP